MESGTVMLTQASQSPMSFLKLSWC